MRRTLLNLYLSKVAQGDSSYESKLGVQLSNRLLYLPLVDDGKAVSKKSVANCKIDALRVERDGKFFIPVFTAKKSLENWCSENSFSAKSISLFGGDIAMVIPEGVSLLINPGDKLCVKLSGVVLEAMCYVEVEEEAEEVEDSKQVLRHPAPEVPAKPVLQIIEPQSEPRKNVEVLQPRSAPEKKQPPSGWYDPLKTSVAHFVAKPAVREESEEEDDQAALLIMHRR